MKANLTMFCSTLTLSSFATLILLLAKEFLELTESGHIIAGASLSICKGSNKNRKHPKCSLL